jgi:structure-specific recognition protein 1
MSLSHGTILHLYQTNDSVAASVQATRTFDLTIELGGTSHAFLNLNREEQKNLEPYFKSKKIRIRNDLDDNSEDLLKKALADESDSELDEPSSDDEGDRPAGGEDEDSEEDEDFQEDSDDEDVAEEYDENAKGSDSGEDASSAGGSDDDMDVDDEDDEDEDEEERPAKKAKTKK